MRKLLSFAASLAAAVTSTSAFDLNSNSNLVVYWGQSSAGTQKPLADYCRDSSVDAIALAFLYQFPNTKLDMSGSCKSTFPGTQILHCPNIASDIKFCQSQGKIVLLSMGGAAGSYGFGSDAEGQSYADTVWNMFLGGSSSQRPFDDAVLDGVDLDIEGGSTAGYAAYIAGLRRHFSANASKRFFITGAPQCPFPDAMLGPTLNSAWFDMVFVQFYNNFCGLDTYPKGFNYADWDTWARTQSVNKNVKIYVGAPGSQTAAGRGYVDATTLGRIVADVRAKYRSFGGVMTWDASQALGGSGWGQAVASGLKAGGRRLATKRSAGRVGSSSSQRRLLQTRAANTADSGHARLEFTETRPARGGSGTFAFLIKIQPNRAPIGGSWELHIPLPPSVRIEGAYSSEYGIRAQQGMLVVAADGNGRAVPEENMPITLHVHGRYVGARFSLPDPGTAVFHFK
ncbi:Chitinase 2 [Dipsacomyces acuminosporus]|nr:Chitinase 2 [Dipsacomyces acuminosporus]